MRLTLMFILVACGGGDTGDAKCVEGFSDGADGLCYEEDGPEHSGLTTDSGTSADEPTVDEVLAALPPCTAPDVGDGQLDVARGCVAGACVGDTYDELVAALGPAESCDPFYFETSVFTFSQLDCAWSAGVEASFDDADRDLLADPGATAFSLDVELPFAGATADGLGLGAEMSCFLALGQPDSVSFDASLVGWYVRTLSIGATYVTDYGDNSGGGYTSDGLADGITFYDF